MKPVYCNSLKVWRKFFNFYRNGEHNDTHWVSSVLGLLYLFGWIAIWKESAFPFNAITITPNIAPSRRQAVRQSGRLGCAVLCALRMRHPLVLQLPSWSLEFVFREKIPQRLSAIYSATDGSGDVCFLPVRCPMSGALRSYVFPVSNRCVGRTIEGIWWAILHGCIAIHHTG